MISISFCSSSIDANSAFSTFCLNTSTALSTLRGFTNSILFKSGATITGGSSLGMICTRSYYRGKSSFTSLKIFYNVRECRGSLLLDTNIGPAQRDDLTRSIHCVSAPQTPVVVLRARSWSPTRLGIKVTLNHFSLSLKTFPLWVELNLHKTTAHAPDTYPLHHTSF